MLPTHLIIETVCKLLGIWPGEFANGDGGRVIDCRHLVVIALLENSRLSMDQVAELFDMKTEHVKYILRKLCNCDKGGSFYAKYLQIHNKIKSLAVPKPEIENNVQLILYP
jgi:hypothetical protein